MLLNNILLFIFECLYLNALSFMCWCLVIDWEAVWLNQVSCSAEFQSTALRYLLGLRIYING